MVRSSLGEEEQRGQVPFLHHILSRVHTLNMITFDADLGHLAGGECQASLLQLPFMPLPTPSSWEGVNPHSPSLRRVEFFSTFLRAGCLHKLFGILHKGFFSSPLFINSIIYLYQNGFMDIYLIFWVIIQYYLILLIKLFQLWPLGALKSSCHTPFIVVFEQFVKLWYIYINTPWNHCGGHGNPLQYSCLENPMDRGAWWATVHGSERIRHNWSDWACMEPPPPTVNIFVTPQRFLMLFPSCLSSHTPYTTPRQPSICFLSPEISWHFLVVYKSGIKQHIYPIAWPLSFSIIILKFISFLGFGGDEGAVGHMGRTHWGGREG